MLCMGRGGCDYVVKTDDMEVGIMEIGELLHLIVALADLRCFRCLVAQERLAG